MKLHINENAISDLRKFVSGGGLDSIPDEQTGDFELSYNYYERKPYKGKFRPGGWTGNAPKRKDALIKWFERILKDNFDFNANETNLVQVEKPRTARAAKDGTDILIGIDSRTGDAMILGQGMFWGLYSGRMGSYNRWDEYSKMVKRPEPDYRMNNPRASYTQEFDGMDTWFKVVPENPETYKTRSQARLDAGRTDDDPIVSGSGRINGHDYNFSGNNAKYRPRRPLTRSEIKLYDPESARWELERRVKDRKMVRQIEALLQEVEVINDRIRQIDFGNPIFDRDKWDDDYVKRLRNLYYSYVDRVKRVQKNGSLQRYELDWIAEDKQRLEDFLSSKFGV